MKKILIGLFNLFLIFTLAACKNSEDNPSNDGPNNEPTNDITPKSKACVAYFSATNTTEKVAEAVAAYIDSDIYEIIPEVLYTSSDLNYNDNSSRANKEQQDANARPKIKNAIPVDKYDTIFLGYPIWWGTLPRIIYTFCDTYNLDDYTIIPFCTSGGTDIQTSVNDLKELESKANVLDGKRFSSTNESEIKAFVDSLKLEFTNKEDIISMEIKISVNGHNLTATLEENESAKAFYELVKDGLTLELAEYGGFEKVGSIGKTLPNSDTRITATPGDLILYASNQLSFMYGSNSWSYTKLGKVNNLEQIDLAAILGTGDVTVTFSI